jgi:hypothetical protein
MLTTPVMRIAFAGAIFALHSVPKDWLSAASAP